MSKFAALDELLQRYHALAYHQNALLQQRLHDVQDWQKQRMQKSHHALFSVSKNQLMAQYFLNRLYGGPDFDPLALQIERLLHYVHKAERLIPDNAIKTGTAGVELAILAVKLDEDVAAHLLAHYPADQAIDDEMMRRTYLALEQQQPRLEQMQLLDGLGHSLDKYMRSFMVYSAYKMCRGVAQKYHFELMYDFMGEGFAAMKPLKSAADFVQQFTAVERQIIEKVHSGHPNPFDV